MKSYFMALGSGISIAGDFSPFWSWLGPGLGGGVAFAVHIIRYSMIQYPQEVFQVRRLLLCSCVCDWYTLWLDCILVHWRAKPRRCSGIPWMSTIKTVVIDKYHLHTAAQDQQKDITRSLPFALTPNT